MGKFCKKPVVIEARQIPVVGDQSSGTWASQVAEIAHWCGGTISAAKGVAIDIPTLEGVMEASPGDWVIRGVKGEFYPCKPDIFAATYTEASQVVDPWAVLEQLQGQIAAEIRVMLGEGQYDQAIFDEAQRQRRIAAMRECAAKSTSDAERHESWMAMHLESGWVYGEEFDPQKKTHPNLKPWDELPASTRSKARIFDFCAKAAAKLAV